MNSFSFSCAPFRLPSIPLSGKQTVMTEECTAYCTLVCVRQYEQKSIEHFFLLSLGGQSSAYWKILFIKDESAPHLDLFPKTNDSVAAMVVWGIHEEQTISSYYFSFKFVPWGAAIRCVHIGKIGLVTRQRARLPASLCNISLARRLSLILLIRHDKKNANKKHCKSFFYREAPAAFSPPPRGNSNTKGLLEGRRLGIFDWCCLSLVVR